MTSTRRAALRAGVVVALTVLTSAAAHLDAARMSIGQLLPRPAGCAVLAAGMSALWLVGTLSDRRLHRGRAREANLLGCFLLGQLLGHLAWSTGSSAAAPGAAMPGHGAMPMPIPMPMPMTEGHLAHAATNPTSTNLATMNQLMASGMPGMAPEHSPTAHSPAMGTAMLVAHLTAALVSQLLLRAAEHLVAHARDWLARLTPQPPHVIQPTPAFRPALDVVLRRSTWALPRPPPRRGPPLPV